MPGKNAKNQKNANPTCIIPISNIKTENVDPNERRNATQAANLSFNASRRLQPINVKKERADVDNNNNNNNNKGVATRPPMPPVKIKTEKPDYADDDVIFVPNPIVNIEINDEMQAPPQKKQKMNNGKAATAGNRNQPMVGGVRIKQEFHHQSNKRARNSNYINFNNSINNWPLRSCSRAEETTSKRLLEKLSLWPNEQKSAVHRLAGEIANLFNVLIYQTQTESRAGFADRLVVAKIRIVLRRNLNLNSVFSNLRQRMIDWVENYQCNGQATPRYHNAFIERPFIIVMCYDSYAYDCLCDFIKFTYSTPGPVDIEYMPRHDGSLLYCYAAVANNIFYNPQLFMRQIFLHTANNAGGSLCATPWILVRHHIQEGFTCFIFFMDYLSAVTLDYVYKRQLFICMADVQFAFRGPVNCSSLKNI